MAPITKMQNAAPPIINTLVAARNNTMINNHQAALQSRGVMSFVRTLGGPQATLSAAGNAAPAASLMQPIASVMPRAAVLAHTLTAGALVRCDQDARWSADADGVALSDGKVVISADRRSLMARAGDIRLSAKKGCAFLLSHSHGITRIVNLTDDRRDSLVVSIAGERMVLAPGQQCLAGRSQAEVCSLICEDGCGWRNKKLRQIGDLSICLCDVSLVSVLKHQPLVQALFRSGHGEDGRLTRKIMRMAACLAYTRPATGYTWVN